MFQHTAARRRLVKSLLRRVKCTKFQHTAARRRLDPAIKSQSRVSSFNTQPPEGGWVATLRLWKIQAVSTHSRPKAAGLNHRISRWDIGFQHTAARRRLGSQELINKIASGVSTHSRPKAAGNAIKERAANIHVSTHSRPKAAGAVVVQAVKAVDEFQHTAARRRLVSALNGRNR